MKLQRNGFDFFLDRIYQSSLRCAPARRIDGIIFAFGEELFRPKAVVSR
ncbi:hypothetical protein D1AOALGA4SA_8654 [Olavius algarvensis Delta 1 endosymbiont]|nr:hypothetical protein D1AOALGA4SA_8654 [Olavius algarvensis Delta 1 endosymbiont]